MKALANVLRAPGLIALVAGAQLVVALVLGSGVALAADLALGRHSLAADDHLFASFLALGGRHPSLKAGYLQTVVGSGVFGLVFWTLLAGAIILRLRSPMPAARLVPKTLAALPGVMATTGWHLLVRALLLVGVGLIFAGLTEFGDWSLAGLVAMLLVLAFSACALDLARCNVMLHGARRFRFTTAARAFGEALRRPAVLLPSMLLSVGQWVCVAAMLALAIDGLGAGQTIWWVRALAVAGVVLGLTRVAVAVRAEPFRR